VRADRRTPHAQQLSVGEDHAGFSWESYQPVAVELLLPARMAGTPLDDSRTARTVALEFRPSRLTRRWLQNAELTSPLALCFRIRSSYSRHRPEQPRVG
jgi:hypothetical protein